MSNIENQVLVSVSMLTYKHELYIKQAIEGVLNQSTNFDFELIIADDCSPDSTNTIVDQLIKTHPNGFRIKYFRQKKNIGMHANGELATNECKGKYIAICEGDDFWTDTSKLQKQVDFLENNKEYGLVHHEADYFFQKKQVLIRDYHRKNKIHVSDGFVFEELLRHNNIYTPTVMFKRQLFEYYLAIDVNVRNKFLMSDYAMWLEFSQHCKFHYIDKSMAVYRVLVNSASNSDDFTKKIFFLKSYCEIKYYFIDKYKVNSISRNAIREYYLQQASVFSLKYSKFINAWIFGNGLRLDTCKKIVLFFICNILYYVKPLRILSKFI